MDLVPFVDWAGESAALAFFGLVIGAAFGVAAEQSRFCLRAAVVDFSRGSFGPRLAVWLLAFGAALFWTQALSRIDLVDLEETRWLASPGTLSGAIGGGLVFGIGMILARGCPGRLLVLGATGNLRAILSGLVFAVFAQMSLHGALAPLRNALSLVWVTDGPNPHLLGLAGLPEGSGLVLGIVAALIGIAAALGNRVPVRVLVFASGVGVAVAAGWFLTFQMSLISFEPVSPRSLTFSGPSADVLMFLMAPARTLDFDIGLVPGVALGAFLSALVSGRLEWQGWSGARSMHRYLIGAALMGFGAMSAGGCAIGAGVTGGSTFALTAWAALTAMWVGAMATDLVVDRQTGAVAGRVSQG